MGRVEMPIDGIAVVQVFVAEKIKPVVTDLVGLADDLLGLLWNPLTNLCQQRWDRGGGEEKLTWLDVRRTGQASRKIESDTGEKNICAFGQLLPTAIETFVSVHARQT